jgi:hypothetical protein
MLPNGTGSSNAPKCGLVYNKYSPYLNERHGMESLALNRQMRGRA